MSLALTAAEVLRKHVTLELESIDRMYLNLYVPGLQRELGVVSFFRHHRKNKFASSALMSPMTRDFVAAIESYARTIDVPIRGFAPGERKEDVALEQRRHFAKSEGVYLIGKAQEKARLFRTERRHSGNGMPYPWIVRSGRCSHGACLAATPSPRRGRGGVRREAPLLSPSGPPGRPRPADGRRLRCSGSGRGRRRRGARPARRRVARRRPARGPGESRP